MNLVHITLSVMMVWKIRVKRFYNYKINKSLSKNSCILPKNLTSFNSKKRILNRSTQQNTVQNHLVNAPSLNYSIKCCNHVFLAIRTSADNISETSRCQLALKFTRKMKLSLLCKHVQSFSHETSCLWRKFNWLRFNSCSLSTKIILYSATSRNTAKTTSKL